MIYYFNYSSVTNIVYNDDALIKSYTYDAYGNTQSADEHEQVIIPSSITYTGAVNDEETGLYYMNARYYDPETGRFISQDTYRGTGEAFWHLYLYCDSDPVNNIDPTGHGKIYIIYYNTGHSLAKFAKNSPFYDTNNKNVYMKSVKQSKDFIKAWNDMSGTIDYVYIFVHGDKGGLLCFYNKDNINCNQINSKLKSKKVNKYVYLLCCYGGAGKEGNNLAWLFAKKSGTKVVACTGGVSYTRSGGVYYPRISPFHGIGVWMTFYYKNGVAKRYLGGMDI